MDTKTKPGHTPGLSIIHADHHGEDGKDALTITWEDRAGKYPVRFTKTYKGRLIAAATDLLDALVNLLEEKKEVGLDEWMGNRTKARAAILRATGGK